MRQSRVPILAVVLGLAVALVVPAAAVAHEVSESTVRFSGNYLWSGAAAIGPVDQFHVDIYDGRFGKEKAALVNAAVYSFRWGPTANGACWIEREIWTGETVFYARGTNVTFTDPYTGVMDVSLAMHGQLSTYEGVVSPAGSWCDSEFEPLTTTDLGVAVFTAAGSWSSEVELRGKKLIKVRTSIEFSHVTFGGSELVPILNEDSPYAASMPRKMQVPVSEFIDNH